MSSDKELADKIVAHGVGESNGGMSYILPRQFAELPTMSAQIDTAVAKYFVRDWRVAGAGMEKCARRGRTIALSFGCDVFNATDAESATPTYGVYLERANKNAARAINEAWVEALND